MSRGLFKKLKTGGRLGVLNSFGHNKVKKSERRGPPTCTFGQEDEVEEEEVDLFVCVCASHTPGIAKRESGGMLLTGEMLKVIYDDAANHFEADI